MSEDNTQKNQHNVAIYGLVVGLALQAFTVIWWASSVEKRIEHMETNVSRNTELLAHRELWGVTLARLDERTANLRTTLDRIDRRTEQLEDEN